MAKLAVWQATGEVLQIEENLGRLDVAAAQAAAGGADVVVTPELFPTGYAPQQVCGSDGAAIRSRMAGIARRHEVAVVGSAVDEDDGVRHISASFFDRDGAELTRYRKSYLFGAEEKSVFVPGASRPEVFSYAGIRIALGICYDVEFPEFVRNTARRGADVLLMPTAVPATGNVDGLPADQTYNAERISTLMVPCRAMENGMYIAYANHAAPGFTGLSCIAGPHGNMLAQAVYGQELLFAAADAQEVRRARRINTYLDDFRADL